MATPLPTPVITPSVRQVYSQPAVSSLPPAYSSTPYPTPVITPSSQVPGSGSGNAYVPSSSYSGPISSYPMSSNPSSSPQTPAPQQAQQQPSSGRSITEDEALRLGYDWNNLPSGYSRNVPQASQEEIDAQMNRAIDEAYNPQMGYLNDAESMLRRDYPTIQAELEAQTKANAAQLAGNKQKAIAGTEKNITEAKSRKEDALSQARRLFAELQRGNIARFGGTSSAGQAASEIQGQEMQRQFGGTQRDFGKFMQDVQAQQAQIETDYNTALLQQEQAKQNALNQANRDFQAKLLEISRLKAETESNKAMRRLQALQDLRNQVFAVNQQNTQFQQQLEAAKYQQQLQLQAYQQQLAGQTSPSYIQGGIDFSRAGSTTGANQPINYAGAISSRRPEDLYAGAISSNAYPIASLPDGRMRYSDGTVK